MLGVSAFAAALWFGWGFCHVARAEDPPASQAALPPSVGESPAEKKIEAALREPISLDIDESSLTDAVDYIKQKGDFEVRLDKNALRDAAVDPSVLITLHVKGIPLASALDEMLEEFDLACVIQRDILRITSKEKADSILITRVYPVADLAHIEMVTGQPRPRPNLGPLMQMIEDTVQPDSWVHNSGVGAIKQVRAPSGAALVISTTRRIHSEIAAVLADIRAVKQLAGALEPQAFDQKKPYLEIYDLGEVSGPKTLKAITGSIAPDTWSDKGGAGRIWAISEKGMQTVVT
ncbi:MAG TPA: hypothetical protein VGJ26_08270, partial [Pirellulales bacterium]